MSIDNNLWRQLSLWGKVLIGSFWVLSILGNSFLIYREQVLGIQPGQAELWAKWTIYFLAFIQFAMPPIFLFILSPTDEQSFNEVRSYLSVELRRESGLNLGDDTQPPRGTSIRENNDFKPLLAAVSNHIIKIMDEDNDDEIRKFAARHLGAIGEKKALPSLIKLLKSETAELQLQSIWSLGELKSKKAVKPLCNLIRKSNTQKEIILRTAQALEKIEDPRAIKCLESVLVRYEFLDYEKEVITETISSLKNSGTPPKVKIN